MWDVLSLLYPCNKDKKCYILLNTSIFPLDYVKIQIKSLQKGSEAYQYVVQNMTCSVLYLRSTLSSILLQKVLLLVRLTETEPEVFVSTMTTFISNSYDALDETLTHTKSLKLKSYPGKKNIDYCAAILVDFERLESARAFKP